MFRKHIGKGFPFFVAIFFSTGVVFAEEVLVVKFPQGERKACSSPATASYVVRGPGKVTTVIKLIPYKSLGFAVNIPVGFRPLGSDNRFMPHYLLPNVVGGSVTQLGQGVENFRDNVPIEFCTIYQLTDEKEYAIEVQAVPQCRMLSQKTYWQEGQEVRFSVEAEGAKLRISSNVPPQPETTPTSPALPLVDVLTSRVWEFGRGDGTVLVPKMKLLSDGRIEGATHPNETRWAVEGNELLFFDASGQVSTRYNSFQQEGGRWVISGPFLLWGNITHVLKEVGETPTAVGYLPSNAVLTSRVWEFGRGDGTVLVPKMKLLSDGRIEGATHPNETRWAVEGNELLFLDAAGQVSTRYNSFQQEGGRWVISGPFLLWGNITHVLKEVGETPTAVGYLPSNAVLTSKIWEFGRGDGTVLVSRMRLLADGRIEGATHPNETRWAVEGNELLFFDASGQVSTRYNSFQQEGGRWVISGPFQLWGNITHVLKEVK